MKIKTLRLPAALLVLGVGLLCPVSPARAISVIPPTFSTLVENSDLILQGTVIDRESRWTVNQAGNRVIKTYFTVRVRETVKGAPVETITLEFFGGTVGDRTMSIAGMPTFVKGQRAWFFVRRNGRVFCPLAYVHHGAYLVQADAASGSERVLRLNGVPLRSVTEIGSDTPPSPPAATADLGSALTSDAFSTAISREVLALQSRQEADR